VVVLQVEATKMNHNDDFLDESFQKLERDRQVILDANKIEHEREVDFVLRFRKIAENEILKIFRAAEEKYGDKLTDIKILDHTMAPVPSVSISFCIVGLYNKKYKLYLSIDGRFRTEEFLIIGKINDEEKIYENLGLSGLTQEIVKKNLSKLISSCR
jgi:hypothetical protein